MHAGSGLGVLARHAFRAKFIGPDRMIKSFVHDLVFRRGASTDGHINTIAEFALDMAGGKTLDELAPIIAATTDEIVESVREPMKAVLELHRNAGHSCVLLSASPQQLVGPIADALGFDYGIGTLIEDIDGVLTGKIIPPMCYGDEKLTRLRAEIGWPLPDCRSDRGRPEPGRTTLALRPGSTSATTTYAYADSMSDLPLLEAVEVPFVVAPDRKLRDLAEARNWPILDVDPRPT